MEKTGFLNWFLNYNEWRTETYKVVENDFFGSIAINTPLVWTKDLINDTYKTTMDIYKQSIVILATALFSGAVLFFNPATINKIYLLIYLLIIIGVWASVHYKMKYQLAYKDIMYTIIFEHDCTKHDCILKHFPERNKGNQ